VIRPLALALLVTALAACTAQPAPQAAPTTTTTTTTAPTTTASAWPRIDTPRRTDGVDTCTLLEPGDFKTMGPFAQPPRPWDKGSCVFQIGDDQPTDLIVMVSFSHSYEEAKATNPKVAEHLVESHSALYGCGPGPNGPTDMSCTEIVAVNADHTVLIMMSLLDASIDHLAQIMTSRVRAVVNRLPLA
jgi:hypothetical protein